MNTRDSRRRTDPFATLPSQELPDQIDPEVLVWSFVIAFHPQASRIGQRWHSSSPVSSSAIAIGRDSPEFAGQGLAPSGLEDQHISREAFTLSGRSGHWVLQRRPGSSRLRVNGNELVDDMSFSNADLRGGVILTLGNRVVLHLRLEPAVDGKDLPEGLETALPGVGFASRELREAVFTAARSTGDVLLIGPTGSGKERAARAVHDFADKNSKPWVAVNMAALPAEIAPASLFGARKGAYTGADQHRQGYFQQAQGGTLFLDEIADAPATIQPLLLRALQEREVQVVGGAITKVSLRVIAAMEWDPDTDTTGLRPALRYRLGAHEIRLPSLAERREDVGLLAMQFLRDLQLESADVPWIGRPKSSSDSTDRGPGPSAGDGESSAARALVARWTLCFESLLLHDWPGNIRELGQVIGQVAAAGLDQPTLPERIRLRQTSSPGAGAAAEEPQKRSVSTAADGGIPHVAERGPQALADIDEVAFLEAWNDAGFSPTKLARSLGVSRAAVYRRVERTEACRLAGDVPLGELLAMLDQCRGDLEQTAEHLSISTQGLATRLRASGIRAAPDPCSGTPPSID